MDSLESSWNTNSDALFENGYGDTEGLYFLSHMRDMGNKGSTAPVTQVSVASSQLCCFPCAGLTY